MITSDEIISQFYADVGFPNNEACNGCQYCQHEPLSSDCPESYDCEAEEEQCPVVIEKVLDLIGDLKSAVNPLPAKLFKQAS